jgi:hypothetical protein
MHNQDLENKTINTKLNDDIKNLKDKNETLITDKEKLQNCYEALENKISKNEQKNEERFIQFQNQLEKEKKINNNLHLLLNKKLKIIESLNGQLNDFQNKEIHLNQILSFKDIMLKNLAEEQLDLKNKYGIYLEKAKKVIYFKT